jgi:hypothetical protein
MVCCGEMNTLNARACQVIHQPLIEFYPLPVNPAWAGTPLQRLFKPVCQNPAFFG